MEEQKRGLQNWRNLLRWPTLDEWINIFIIVMVLFAAWAYKHDIASCQEALTGCVDDCNGQLSIQAAGFNERLAKTGAFKPLNVSGLISNSG